MSEPLDKDLNFSLLFLGISERVSLMAIFDQPRLAVQLSVLIVLLLIVGTASAHAPVVELEDNPATTTLTLDLWQAPSALSAPTHHDESTDTHKASDCFGICVCCCGPVTGVSGPLNLGSQSHCSFEPIINISRSGSPPKPFPD